MNPQTARGPAPLALEVIAMSKRFGALLALDHVSLRVRTGSVHALLGENGAGKSTLVKCIMGYHRPDDGDLLVWERERTLNNPRDAHALGLGMVYQHFTLVPNMTVVENLLMGRPSLPAVIPWARERQTLEAFVATMPFRVDLDAPVHTLAAGEKQKVELLKQLYLDRRLLILDEPTSVLTPHEADDMLGLLHRIATPGPEAPLGTLSGGNVQRTVLARELSEKVYEHVMVLQGAQTDHNGVHSAGTVVINPSR